VSAWLTRRTQAPQCIPSIRNTNSAIFHPVLIDDSWTGKMHPVLRLRGAMKQGYGVTRRKFIRLRDSFKLACDVREQS
jgi:hypothetical protein